MSATISRRRMLGMGLGAVVALTLEGVPRSIDAQAAAPAVEPVAHPDGLDDIRLRHSSPACAAAFAVAFDEWTVAEIRELLDDWDDVGLAMAYFHRIGFRFSWYQRAPDADPKLWNTTGLIWTSGFADPGYDRPLWSAEGRDLLEHWFDRIKAHVYALVAANGLPIAPGFHHINYRLTGVSGAYLPAWERAT